MHTMKATEVRNNIGSLWTKAAEQPVMIESVGKPIAVVLSVEEYDKLAKPRQLREFGCGRHLLVGVDVDELLARPIDDMFADYIPEEKYRAGVKQEASGTHPAACCGVGSESLKSLNPCMEN